MPGEPDDITVSMTNGSLTPLPTRGGESRFEIVRKLGEGGMAVVYEAIDRKLGERRALKFSKSGHAHSIPPEARAALRVTHENVCRAFEIHTASTKDGPADFISMEYVEGETLAKRWRREPLTQTEALEIARQLCRGVQAAHEAKVLHLDLKSANVMLTTTPSGRLRVIVMDFGLAQAFGDGTESENRRFGGTPNYIAPERYLGAEPTPATDIYSMGVILYEMLTGARPQAKVLATPDPPSKAGDRKVDPRWDPIVLRCLEANPEKRTATAAELLAAIDSAFTETNRRKWLAAAAASVTLGGGLWALRDRIWPAPLLARLAMLPLAGSTGDKSLDERLRGALTEVAARLESLGAESRRLLLIQPEEAVRHMADTVEAAKGRLGATHSFAISVQGRPGGVAVHAEIRATDSGDLVKGFDAEFPVGELAALSASLAGVVTFAFQLGKTLEANVNKEAYPFYAGALGLLARDRVSYDRALALLDMAWDQDRQSGLIQAARTTAYLQKFRNTKDDQWLKPAGEAAESAGRLHPDHPTVLLALGDLDREEGRPEKAMERYERAAALEPNRSRTWEAKGIALQRMGKSQEAVAALRKAIALAPGYYAPHATLAALHFQNGRITEAVNEQKIATETAPEQPAAFLAYGGMLVVAEREGEAEAAFRRCMELQDPRAPISMNNLGVLLRYQNRSAEAAEVFLRSLRVEPNSIVLRLNLGNTLKAMGRTGEARQEFEKAGELARKTLLRDPRDASARARLAFVQSQTGSKETALDNALQASTMAANEYTVQFWVTMTFEALGKRELAEPVLQKATPQQLKDLRRQPDLQEFFRDPRFEKKK